MLQTEARYAIGRFLLSQHCAQTMFAQRFPAERVTNMPPRVWRGRREGPHQAARISPLHIDVGPREIAIGTEKVRQMVV
jgi:hypothetical protein